MTNLYDPRFEYNSSRGSAGWNPKDQDAMDASVNEYMQSDEFKRKAASKQGTKVSEITRLEDLPFHLLEAVLQITTEKVDTNYDTIYRPLFEMGLVDYDESDEAEFFGVDILTERGAALVADYQRRQAEAAAEHYAHESTMEESIFETSAERQPAGADITNAQYHSMQSHCQSLEVEVKRLKSNLQDAQSEFELIHDYVDLADSYGGDAITSLQHIRRVIDKVLGYASK